MFLVRKALWSDIPTLIDMDVKYWDDENYDNPWTEQDWNYRLQFDSTYVMVHRGEPVGFVTYDALDEIAVYAVKLIVKPQYRRMGVAYSLLQESGYRMRLIGFSALRLYATDKRLDPRRDDDLSTFLTRSGFKPREHIRLDEGKNDFVLFEKDIDPCLLRTEW